MVRTNPSRTPGAGAAPRSGYLVPVYRGSGRGGTFAVLLIVRRAAEWFAEVFLSEQELGGGRNGLSSLILIQATGLCAVLLAIQYDFLVTTATLLWACSPLLYCRDLQLWRLSSGRGLVFLGTLQGLLPHFGSTLAIGFSVYFFRLSIVLLAGKEVAGDLFAAFALGGLLGAVFSQALGPSTVRQERVQNGGLLAICPVFQPDAVAGCALGRCVAAGVVHAGTAGMDREE